VIEMAERGLTAQFVHRNARRATSLTGQLTARSRMEPDFLIVGAQRCGTTALYKTLVQHPAVLGAGLHKGVHYFDTAYSRGPAWYRGHFPRLARARRVEQEIGTRPVTGEASPYYMFHPLAGERIARELPHVKLVAVLRDPVERAYSAYTPERARGYETETFERALELEPERLAGEEERLRADPTYASGHHQHNAYLARGRYIEQVLRMEALVGPERLLVLDFDEMFGDLRRSMPRLLDFLGLPPWMPDGIEKRNARPRSALPESTRLRLDAYFAPYDDELAAWWGRTPSWRR
jgi:hypothetical protein